MQLMKQLTRSLLLVNGSKYQHNFYSIGWNLSRTKSTAAHNAHRLHQLEGRCLFAWMNHLVPSSVFCHQGSVEDHVA